MLTARELRQLDRLALAAPNAPPAAGTRHARTHGHGLEFRDYRRYQPGDDPRMIDWTVEARLKQLVVRTFRAEGRLQVHLVVDTSASMGIGSPSKLTCAARIGAALAYVAAERRDALGVTTFDAAIRHHVPAANGRPPLMRATRLLQSVEASGPSDLDDALTAFASAARGASVAIVMSDFFDTAHRFEGLDLLRHRGVLPALVQVVADGDVDPDVVELTELVDAEHPERPPLLADETVVRAYHGRVSAITTGLRDYCFAHKLPWIHVRSSASFDDIVQACVSARLLAVYS